MTALPPRYEPIRRLGQGGGGEVWAVRDRVTDRALALKVLSPDAGESEVMALVREAVALSGLEGLRVPHVVAFGALEGGRRYMVRELVEGQSLQDVLDDESGPDWLAPLVHASEQVTVLHRSGLLHGDIKPANVIVGPGGTGTLVDLGLATPWGTAARGLTPKYAAPEVLMGDAITARAEVYALGATLAEGLARRGSSLSDDVRFTLVKVAARAMEEDPAARHPSVDELTNAIRSAAGLSASSLEEETPWPVLGADPVAQRLATAVSEMSKGEALVISGPPGSGRSTLARRLAWTLGVEGRPVAAVERPRGDVSFREVLELELDWWARTSATGGAKELIVVLDDADELDEASREAVRRTSEAGAKLVAVGTRDRIAGLVRGRCRTFEVPPLEPRDAEELLRRAVPSLPEKLHEHLLRRVGGRPGSLRSFVRKLGKRAVVSAEDIDAVFAAPSIAPPSSLTRAQRLALVERTLDMGRFGEADKELAALEAPRDEAETVAFAIARARIALGRGDAKEGAAALDAVAKAAQKGDLARAWRVQRARAFVRAGDYAAAEQMAAQVADDGADDALTAEAMASRGVAQAYMGDDAAARRTLERAVEIAKRAGDRRVEGVALGSLAIAHARAGRNADARQAHEAALAAAESARDASTMAATRLNLATLAHADGDFAAALGHLEAAVDLGRRAGGLVAVQQALLNLANLDIYLGRYARARASIESLVAERSQLGPHARAQLLGLEADLATRTGDVTRGAELYELCAIAWEAVARPLDAAETRLESILARTRESGADARQLLAELDRLRAGLGDEGFREHEALAGIVRGSIALLAGDEPTAKTALDRALDQAQKAGRREWAWRALDARARLAASQGAVAMARRDTEAALALLEETASKLPRDLREVFWDDPRRRALRQAHTATAPQPVGGFHSDAKISVFSTSSSSSGSSTLSSHGGSTSHRGPLPAEDRLARIFEITRELATEHDMDRLLGKVTDHAIALLGAERGFVVLVNDAGELETHTARDRKGDDPHAKFSRSVAEKVVRSGEPVVATSARDDERLAQAVSVHQLMIQSIACVPIRGAPPVGRTIGALYVETRLRPGLRFGQELPTLSAFADAAAIAIESARLISENQQRAAELEAANAELAAAKDRLAEILGRRTEQLAATRRDLKQVRAELRSHFGYQGLVGTSTAMRKVYALIDRVKDTDIPILVTGESGTGKEVIAKAVHNAGPRAKAPFLGVNCGAIPENLLESELFGHVKGAFTGADRDRKGLFREAQGGTILLDEIGEMPLKMQAGLLRVLQEKTVRPVGGTQEQPIDARVVAATNRDLSAMVREGTFREDLYYRLHVVEIRVPALRERKEDIPPLIDHFLTLFSSRYRREKKTVERDALRRLTHYDWPGNVRQLEHVLLNAWLMSEKNEIQSEDLSLPDRGASHPISDIRPSVAPPVARSQEEFKTSERDKILSALSSCNWNRVQAAKLVGIPRRTFYRRLKEYGIL
jgi:transcriptional regulator with GAF, ATPase, and Fis domain/energy-coupling factor transporter ATP-binding protein EcfA2